jgi:hypothetical protein
VEVFLSLIARNSRPGKLVDRTANYRLLISKHKESYFNIAKYTPIVLVNAQQIGLYECMKIQTAYLNHIKANFGNKLRTILNKLCKKRELADGLREQLKKDKVNTETVNKALRETLYDPCNQVKSAVEKKEMPEATILGDSAREKIKSILQCYPDNCKFKKDSIFYNVKVNPECHYKAFFKITQLFDSEELRQFSCFPLRTSSIPCYMTLDSKVIHQNILKLKAAAPTKENKF